MDPALFSKLAPQVAELAEIAYLHILGEAFLHPDLERITAFAKEADLPLGMTKRNSFRSSERTDSGRSGLSPLEYFASFRCDGFRAGEDF